MTFLGLRHLPWLLAALGLGLVALVWAIRARRTILRRLTAGQSSAPALRTSMAPVRRILRTTAMVASLVLLGITVLRPIGGSIITENRLPAKNLILLIDVSKSMGVPDSDGLTRLEAAKLFAREFINRRPSDRIGLVSFDGVAFPECPTTLSRTMLLRRLDIQTPGGLPVQGSDLPGALKEAGNLLTGNPPPGSAIILLSDGDRLTSDPDGDASPIASRKVPLFTVHFGNPAAESPIPDSKLQSRADPGIMRQLALATGALDLPGSSNSLERSLQRLTSQIDTMKIDRSAKLTADLRSRPLELYAYPLALALAFLCIRFFLPARSRTKWHPLTPAIVLASLLCFPVPADAQTPDTVDALPETTDTVDTYVPFTKALEQSQEKKRPLLVIFTGSDWSEASISFETEILSHQIYQQWAGRAVVTLTIDLPRAGLAKDTRSQRREIASRLGVTAFPTAVFLDLSETELGRLGHDTDGPASWVRRAELILAGSRAASALESSIKQLPESVRQSLEAEGITPVERALRHYNLALEYRQLDPALSIASPDRFQLLDDLLSTASSLAPRDRPDLEVQISKLRATLHHERGRALLPPQQSRPHVHPDIRAKETEAADEPEAPDESDKSDKSDAPAPPAPAAPVLPPDPEAALRTLRDALSYYQDAARFDTGHDDLTPNLSRLHLDIEYANNIIAFQAAYKDAIEKTAKLMAQENKFRDHLDRGVTTSRPVNDDDLEASRGAITRLVALGELIAAPMIEDIRAADEDIRLAPDPHQVRHLHPSAGHIRDAYDHLVKPVQQQGQGEGEGNDQQDGEDDGDGKENDTPKAAGGDQDLRRARKGSGDLRDRQLEELGKSANGGKKPKPSPGQQH